MTAPLSVIKIFNNIFRLIDGGRWHFCFHVLMEILLTHLTSRCLFCRCMEVKNFFYLVRLDFLNNFEMKIFIQK